MTDLVTKGLINIGIRRIQAQRRIFIGLDICKWHDLDVGDPIEVFIKPVKKDA